MRILIDGDACPVIVWATMAGFGRQTFAYPDFAKDLLEKGKMESWDSGEDYLTDKGGL